MKGRGIGTARGRATIMRGTLQLSSSVRTFLLMYASFHSKWYVYLYRLHLQIDF